LIFNKGASKLHRPQIFEPFIIQFLMKLLALILLVVSGYGVSAQCSAPTGLSTSNITATAATASWAPVSGATSYNVEYMPPTYSYWITIANETTSLQWTLSGMEPLSTYKWRVRANCPTGASNYSETQFTTLGSGSCAAPAGLSTSNITSTTATVNWNPVNGAFAYSVYYKASSSSFWLAAVSATYGTSANLYGLSAGITYDWLVYSNCSLTEASNNSYSQFTTSGSTPAPTSGCPGPYDISTNGNISGAAGISLNTEVKGTIAPKYDVDHYKFTISSPGTINVWLTTLPANYDLAVLNSSGAQIGISKNKGSKNESVPLNVVAGTYYAKVYPTGNANSATSCYTLKVQTVTATRVAATATNATGTSAKENVNPIFTVNLFPNPAGDQLNVWVEGVDQRSAIKVYNLMGKLVMQQGIANTITQLNISKLPAGLYLVHVNDGTQTRASRFVKR
jgi:hypothetical protein